MRKRKVEITVVEKKKGLFGTKTVRKKRTVQVDEKTLRKMKRNRPYTLEEMAFYDWIFDE